MNGKRNQSVYYKLIDGLIVVVSATLFIFGVAAFLDGSFFQNFGLAERGVRGDFIGGIAGTVGRA